MNSQEIPEDSAVLIARFRDGDEAAAAQLFAKYFDRLDQFVERRLSDRLQQRIGADDIAQSVYRSFFQKAKQGIYDGTSGGDLWRLLSYLANRKIQQKVEWHSAQKRDPRREQTIDSERSKDPSESGAAQQTDIDDAIEYVLQNVCENWQQVIKVSQLETDISRIAERTNESETNVRKVLILRMKCAADVDNEELAEILQCSEVTVRRIWRNLLEFAEGLSTE